MRAFKIDLETGSQGYLEPSDKDVAQVVRSIIADRYNQLGEHHPEAALWTGALSAANRLVRGDVTKEEFSEQWMDGPVGEYLEAKIQLRADDVQEDCLLTNRQWLRKHLNRRFNLNITVECYPATSSVARSFFAIRLVEPSTKEYLFTLNKRARSIMLEEASHRIEQKDYHLYKGEAPDGSSRDGR